MTGGSLTADDELVVVFEFMIFSPKVEHKKHPRRVLSDGCISYSCTKFLSVFVVMGTENVVNDTGLGNQE